MSGTEISTELIEVSQLIPELKEDIDSWWRWRNPHGEIPENALQLLFSSFSKFRSLVRYRLTSAGMNAHELLPARSFSTDTCIVTASIGGGRRIQHGHSTWVLAETIKECFSSFRT